MPLAIVDPPRKFLHHSSWGKKELADFHLDMLRYCGFGCKYCSTNSGFTMRFMKASMKEELRQQLGRDFNPHRDGDVAIGYRNSIRHLQVELFDRSVINDTGKTVVYSQLTDGFSPNLVAEGVPRKALELLLKHTKLRIRILTKNAVVGESDWIDFFLANRDRFVVGLSIGTLNDQFASTMEAGTSLPSERVEAHHRLQDAGVQTFGMMCPVFRHVVMSNELEALVHALRPELCEKIWFEPYNSRNNWKQCQDVYENHWERKWFTDVFEDKQLDLWSEYAGHLYRRMRHAAEAGGWTDKLRYLLYEKDFTADYVHLLGDLVGVLFQSPVGDDGFSKNDAIRDLQRRAMLPGELSFADETQISQLR